MCSSCCATLQNPNIHLTHQAHPRVPANSEAQAPTHLLPPCSLLVLLLAKQLASPLLPV